MTYYCAEMAYSMLISCESEGKDNHVFQTIWSISSYCVYSLNIAVVITNTNYFFPINNQQATKNLLVLLIT